MVDSILLNDHLHYFNEGNLPCLIHYKSKEGGSHFSVTLVANLFLNGSKILFFTAYPMAKDNFLQQIRGNESKIAYITNENQFNTQSQVVILESGNEELFFKALNKLSDLQDRVVLIKNVEVFSEEIFNSIFNLRKVIVSGNIDVCCFRKRINSSQYKTIVFFSKPTNSFGIKLPVFKKYNGYLWSEDKTGLISVKKKNE